MEDVDRKLVVHSSINHFASCSEQSLYLCIIEWVFSAAGQLSKIAIGDMLQNLRPLYNNTKSMWASLDQIPPSRLSELMGNAFPYDVLRAYMTGP